MIVSAFSMVCAFVWVQTGGWTPAFHFTTGQIGERKLCCAQFIFLNLPVDRRHDMTNTPANTHQPPRSTGREVCCGWSSQRWQQLRA